MIAEFSAPSLPLLARQAGFDFVLIDREHGAFTIGELRALLLCAQLAELPSLVRVPGVDPHAITEVLDLGAAGIVVPRVEAVKQAAAAASAARFPPAGSRGVSLMKGHTRYEPHDVPTTVARVNAATLVYLQIESGRGLADVDRIAACSGVDGLLLGPVDLAQDLGRPGQTGHPEVVAAVARIAAATSRAGISGGTITSDPVLLRAAAEHAMSLFVLGNDVGHFLSGAREALARLRRIA